MSLKTETPNASDFRGSEVDGEGVSDFGVSILENECCSCTQRKESVVTFVALPLQVFMYAKLD